MMYVIGLGVALLLAVVVLACALVGLPMASKAEADRKRAH